MLPVVLILLSGQSLALVEGVEWKSFRADVEKLVATKNLLPPATVKAVRAALNAREPDAEAVQKLLDVHCLFGVHINPESRVKAVRGEREAVLVKGRPLLFLVKVQNEGGVTHPLAIGSEQATALKRDDADHWFRVGIVDGKLSGRKLDYRIIRLEAHQSGKREATFHFDVGQGTQDLGYRAEVPVLFRISAEK